jgi:phosphoribosylamine--glycine ligase / phosphoribosylformylglycinamidine cyclo-ligase
MKSLNILLLGTGGREHVIAWKLLQSPRVQSLYFTAENGIIETLQAAKPTLIQPIPKQVTLDAEALTCFAQQKSIDLVVIGPEVPLAAGFSNYLRAAGLKVFGPSQAAAQLESSKAFAKAFMRRHHLPTARYAVFTDYQAASEYLHTIDYSIVIKASGLAAGKGVFLPDDKKQADECLQALLIEKKLGIAGTTLIIEERLFGPELSLLGFTDGETVKVMPPARDYKRLKTGNHGPNTGGMGVYAPVVLPSGYCLDHLSETILMPTLEGLRKEQTPFCGILYAGLILTTAGPKILEFNCRLGDPEAQTLLPLLETDLLTILEACVHPGQLQALTVNWKKQAAVCVVLASQAYPEKPTPPTPITGVSLSYPSSEENCLTFQAGTRYQNGQLLATGGRVLNIAAVADTLATARKTAYEKIQQIHFQGMQYREDIGQIMDENSRLLSKPAFCLTSRRIAGEKPSHLSNNEFGKSPNLYRQAGVDIHAGNQVVQLIKESVHATYTPQVLSSLGGFGGLFEITALKNLQKPVLVASTDGVGTKVLLGLQADRLESLGQDIVNHCVNDILVQNARPLFFLDYIACDRLHPQKIARLVQGMSEACQNVGCALLGGETAEMPGIYQAKQCDIAGTMVGVVEAQDLLPQSNCQAGDILWGLRASGPHTNGYSLLRKVFADTALDASLPELEDQPLKDVLLAPHRCYLPVLEAALNHPLKPIKALAHITGGGFFDNIPRVLPEGLQACLNLESWPIPPLFQLIQKRTQSSFEALAHILNLGIGIVLVASPAQSALLHELIPENIWEIGILQAGNRKVFIKNTR